MFCIPNFDFCVGVDVGFLRGRTLKGDLHDGKVSFVHVEM